MSNVIRSLAVLAAICAVPAPSQGADSTDWAEGFNNKARLLVGHARGGPYGDAEPAYAGLEIVMDPGFKTYWRNPGEAGGIPPEIDFSGSENLKSATVLYPAPHRTKDKAGENIGYHDSVIFPLRIIPEDPAKPVALRVTAAYGVCKDICIPAEAELQIDIDAGAEASSAIAGALARVPRPAPDPSRSSAALAPGTVPARADVDPRLIAWRLEKAGKPKLVLEVEEPAASGETQQDDADAFLFSADGLYMPMTRKVSHSSGTTVYEADITEGASASELAGKTISITLTGTQGQSETFIALPGDLASP